MSILWVLTMLLLPNERLARSARPDAPTRTGTRR
jgi:hypothetical protein